MNCLHVPERFALLNEAGVAIPDEGIGLTLSTLLNVDVRGRTGDPSSLTI